MASAMPASIKLKTTLTMTSTFPQLVAVMQVPQKSRPGCFLADQFFLQSFFTLYIFAHFVLGIEELSLLLGQGLESVRRLLSLGFQVLMEVMHIAEPGLQQGF